MSGIALNGRTIGLAHYATRAALEARLAERGLTFHQEVALNGVGAEGGEVAHEWLIARLTDGLKVSGAVAAEAVDGLLAAGHLAEGPEGRLALTPSGTELHQQVAGIVGEIVEAVYGDLSEADKEVTARVLTTITERANALLANA